MKTWRPAPQQWLAAALAALILALYLLFPLTGDDYGYMGSFRTINGFDGPWPLSRFYRWFPFHWLHANGRLANFCAMTALTFLPKWLIAAIMGCATWLMMALALRLGDAWRGRTLAATAALAYIAVAYPWWDLMYTVDFNFNYPVATAAGVGAIYLWQRYNQEAKRWSKALCLGAMVIAGGFHESMGAPLLAACAWMLFAQRRWPQGSGRLSVAPVAAFAAGVAIAFTSPGIWARAAQSRVADAPLGELLLCSAPLTLGAIALFGVLLLWPRWRGWMAREARSWWGFWMVAAICALPFCAAGGIMGRSGWFSQTFALIALLQWTRALRGSASPVAISVSKLATAILGAAALFFTAAPIPYVARMAKAEAEARAQLVQSRDGVVFADLPDENALPWYTLRRVRTLDPDDYYIHQVVADYYGAPRFLILPATPERRTLTPTLPSSAVPLDPATFNAPPSERFLHTAPDGVQTVYCLIPGTPALYYASPRILDPGDPR